MRTNGTNFRSNSMSRLTTKMNETKRSNNSPQKVPECPGLQLTSFRQFSSSLLLCAFPVTTSTCKHVTKRGNTLGLSNFVENVQNRLALIKNLKSNVNINMS